MTTQTATPFLSFRGGTLGALTPLILLATLFLDRKQTVHDRLLGTVVVRTDIF